jgi:hypothetical protein
VQPTYIGAIVALIGILAFRKQMTVMLLVVLVGTLFGAASAVNMTSLGGSSILPSVFALVFLAARMAASRDLLSNRMAESLKDSVFFAAFAFYGFLSAYIFPRLFFHQIELPPTKVVSLATFAVAPLGPSSQNITQSTYLLGTFFVVLATAYIARTERRSRLVAMTVVWLAIAHVLFGILDVVFNAAGLDILNVVRNANYSIVDQEIGGFRRIQGTFAETSSYSGYGLALLIFTTELWLRQVEEKLTGWTSLILAVTLFMTTSSSAYFGLGVYGLVLAARIVYFPSPVAQRKGLILAIFGIVAISAVLLLCVAMPAVANEFGRMLTEMTVKKQTSFSGIQRGFWNQKGWEAFLFSNGVGVGVGSFRASSLAIAIVGSMGVPGALAFALFVYRVLPLHRLSTYQLTGNRTEAVGSAAGWAAIVGLAPGLVSAANPDPGVVFAFMAGIALAWAPRSAVAVVHRPAPMVRASDASSLATTRERA